MISAGGVMHFPQGAPDRVAMLKKLSQVAAPSGSGPPGALIGRMLHGCHSLGGNA